MHSSLGYTVAVADDHPYMRRALILTITSLGYAVTLEAKNGRELVAQLKQDSLPSVCIVDMRMPEMDGLETIRYVKRQWPSVKILVYSMNEGKASKDKALDNGADAYLEKGSTLAELGMLLASLAMQGSVYAASTL